MLQYIHVLLGTFALLCLFGHIINAEHVDEQHITLANFGEEHFSFHESLFILYDVNPPEGFNLRRDVYMRIANSVRQLREKGQNYILVLPPWGDLYHWRKRINRLKWAELFDVESLNRFVPVIEFEDFLNEYGDEVDLLLYLQHYKEGWSEKDGFVLKHDIRPCIDAYRYYHQDETTQKWSGHFFSYGREFRAKQLKCLSIQGQSSTLVNAILERFSQIPSVMVDRAETILHDHFGNVNYWRSRRSMRYAKKLRKIGDVFRLKEFNSTDKTDGTNLDENWENVKKKSGEARGGNYLCAHLRRRDFIRAHAKDVPSIEGAAEQLSKLMQNLGLIQLFLSTDADKKEVDRLNNLLKKKEITLKQFSDDNLPDVSVSVVDQWICAHARHFIGTHQSTFSYRIHDDREILGFSPTTTFNRLCGDNQTEVQCEQPAKWTIVYD